MANQDCHVAGGLAGVDVHMYAEQTFLNHHVCGGSGSGDPYLGPLAAS